MDEFCDVLKGLVLIGYFGRAGMPSSGNNCSTQELLMLHVLSYCALMDANRRYVIL